MNKWDEINIGEEVNILSGFPFDSKKFNTEGEGLPLIRIRDILTSSIETYYNGEYSDTYVIRKGDILVGMDGDFHVRRWNNINAILNQRILKVYQKKGAKIDIDFFYYFLQPFLLKVNDLTAATTVKHLSTYDITRAKKMLPSLTAQKRIAKILSTTDSVIEKTEAAIAKYKAIKQGLMQDLFIRGIDIKTGKLRPSYEDVPSLYKESELGWIPKEWTIQTISDLVYNLDGKRIPLSQEIRQTRQGVYPYYGASGIIDYVDDFIFDESLILLGEDGENVVSRNLPLAFIVTGKIWVNNHAHVLKPKEDMNIFFLCEFLESMDYSNVVSGSAQPKITQGHLNKIKVGKPSTEEQNIIADRLTSIEKLIVAEKKALVKYMSIKDGLMQDLLSGKVEVKINEKELAE